MKKTLFIGCFVVSACVLTTNIVKDMPQVLAETRDVQHATVTSVSVSDADLDDIILVADSLQRQAILDKKEKDLIKKEKALIKKEKALIKKEKALNGREINSSKSTKPTKPSTVKSTATSLSQNDKDILLRIVEAETTGGDVTSKMYVTSVILNRIKSDTFPNSMKEVVFQKNQFTPTADGRYYSVSITKETKEAVNRVLAGENIAPNALFFCTPSCSSWFNKNLKFLFYYGGHNYYALKR